MGFIYYRYRHTYKAVNEMKITGFKLFMKNLTTVLEGIREVSEEMDGRNPKVKHIRTLCFAGLDIINKVCRLKEMEDE